MASNAENASFHDAILLTQRMRKGSKQIHDKSDRLVNLKLAFVLTSPKLYGEALGLFAPIYRYLEEAIIERHGKNHAQLRCFAELMLDIRRYPRFESDIQFFLGKDEGGGDIALQTKKKETMPKELRDYLNHLETIENEDPVLLVAYVYHMYMAILAGGFVIRKMVKRAMGLKRDSDDGIRGLSFDERNIDCRAIKTKIKHFVNVEMKLNKAQEERILEESVKLFQMNNTLVSTIHDSPTLKQICDTWIKRWLIFCAIVLGILMAIYFR